MWPVCMTASIGCLLLAPMLVLIVNRRRKDQNRKLGLFNVLFVGMFAAAFFMFLPAHLVYTGTAKLGKVSAVLLSLYKSMQVFTIGSEYDVVKVCIVGFCPAWLEAWYLTWAAAVFVLAPIFTFGFVLSLFKNLSANVKLSLSFFKDTYVFSELNEKSIVLAKSIKDRDGRVSIVFADVIEDNEENTNDLIARAGQLGAICFKKDILAVDLSRHSKKSILALFAIGKNEAENLNQSLKLIEQYRHRADTHLYVFSKKIESELLLTAVDKGQMKVRRINEVQSLINRILYEDGAIIFDGAGVQDDGTKKISAIIVGMGNHGTEMLKALAWYGQMDGYQLEINAFDKDPMAEERFNAAAPELMSPVYNGARVEGEAQYRITIHSGMDADSLSFGKEIEKISDATYVIVALGNDDVNINTAVRLRMYFERMRIHPVIQAIVYNTQQKKALEGIQNYRGQKYDIDFIGDLESSFAESVIVGSELEEEALQRHLKWGKEDEFWTYEYNYRSSVASAIHMRARIYCGIPGADKNENDLTEEEKPRIEALEHRRWNAYMRAEGYIFSGSKEKSSRNDLAKMHHDLVDYASLHDDEKRKDSKVGTR